MAALDRRENPRYSIGQAALYLGIPPSTVRSWVVGRTYAASGSRKNWLPIIEPAGRDMFGPCLSFFNIAEVHVLAATRDYNVPVKSIRKAIEFIVKYSATAHPLIGQDFYTDGKNLFVKELEEYINATQGGQYGFREILEMYLKKIVTDDKGLPIKLFPVVSKDFENRVVCIMPDVGSGMPVVNLRGVRASAIWQRYNGGETKSELADDYEMELVEIEQAIDYFRYIKRAA